MNEIFILEHNPRRNTRVPPGVRLGRSATTDAPTLNEGAWSHDVAHPSARDERTRDHDRRLRRLGDRRRGLVVRLGTAGRRAVYRDDAARARAGRELDRYRGCVRSGPLRRSRRPAHPRPRAERPSPCVHQVRPGVGRARPHGGPAACPRARIDPARGRGVTPPARRGADRPVSVSLARRDRDTGRGLLGGHGSAHRRRKGTRGGRVELRCRAPGARRGGPACRFATAAVLAHPSRCRGSGDPLVRGARDGRHRV